MAILGLLEKVPLASTISLAIPLGLISLVSILIYRAFFSHLASTPGPLICRFTSIWTWYHSYIGDECSQITALHNIYGPVVRIAPNECSISDGAALAPIYSERGGFKKAACYSNFDIEGHATIFSTTDSEYRAKRSKAVVPMFSLSNIRSGQDVLEDCVQRYLARVREEASSKKPVNILNVSRSLALDAVSSYLFQRPYGGIEEKDERLSASTYVDVLVAVGRFFFLPNWIFLALEMSRQKFLPSKEEQASDDKVGRFAKALVQEASPENETFQGRLKKAGISDHEIEVQCKDLMFAGTDSTGTNLSTICWWLAKSLEVYTKLKQEVAEADSNDPTGTSNPQSVKYLDAVVREGLRMSMANPTRFPRVVPKGGWTLTASNGGSYYFPEGTMVGCQPYTLHFNPKTFPEPLAYRPERWLENPSMEMQRDAIPFGLGQRQCIARNLAQMELSLAVRAIAREGLLDGAKAVGEKIELLEWFNSKIVGEKIEIQW